MPAIGNAKRINIISTLVISFFVYKVCGCALYRYMLLGKANCWGLCYFICLSSYVSLLFPLKGMLRLVPKKR